MAERVLVVIPARYGSSRFPGKALVDLGGVPLIVRTAQGAARMREATQVVVATDDGRIRDAVEAAGISCIVTGEHPTGTDRIGEVLEQIDADLVVNLQGDEPLLDPQIADALVRTLKDDPDCDLVTCAHPFTGRDEWCDPNAVKVLVDRRGHALYFSRAAVPGCFPDGERDPDAYRLARRHVGIYGWRAAALRRFLTWPRGELECIEGLEQLRALEHGLAIRVLAVPEGPIGVDTPGDLERVRALWQEQFGGGSNDPSPGRND